eukprot:848551-Pelagomonas_calceolata.AAC.1
MYLFRVVLSLNQSIKYEFFTPLPNPPKAKTREGENFPSSSNAKPAKYGEKPYTMKVKTAANQTPQPLYILAHFILQFSHFNCEKCARSNILGRFWARKLLKGEALFRAHS